LVSPAYSSQYDPQIGHPVPASGTAIDLEGAEHAHESGIDLRFAPFREQHGRSQLAAGQAAAEGFADHVRMAAQGLATVPPAPDHGVEVLIPKQGEFAERLQP